MQSPVYLDYNATTPCLPPIVETMLPYFSDIYANAASNQYLAGWKADEAVEKAREEVAELIHARPKEIIFTSGATEAVNLAIKGVVEGFPQPGGHIITASTEHNAVLKTCNYLQKKGIEITYLPVDQSGLINLHDLETAIRSDTRLITIMLANNETGVLQPLTAIYQLARKYKIPFFTDATQAVGKIPVHAPETADLLCFSAHKMYGPKGIGCLYINKKNYHSLLPQIHGGGHEKNLRSGTLNVPAIVGFGKAASIANTDQVEENNRIILLRNKLESMLLQLDGASLNGINDPRLPHVSNISFSHVEGTAFLKRLNQELAVSSGSACSSVINQPSHVLIAMGLQPARALASVRFSLGRLTTEEAIDFTIQEVRKVWSELSFGAQ